MPGGILALPSANEAATATPSWAVSSADPDYPVTNVITLEPDVVAKAIAATATLRVTLGGSETIVAAGLFNTNLGGTTVTLTNNGGMASQPRIVPNPEDGLNINVWWDLRSVANNAGSQWDFACATGGDPVAIGTVVLISAVLLPRLSWSYEILDRFHVIAHRSSHGKRFQYRIPTRYRMYRALARWAEDRPILRSLRYETDGTITPFFLVPDEDDEDVLLVQFSEDTFRELYEWVSGSFEADTAEGIVPQQIEVEEAHSGVEL